MSNTLTGVLHKVGELRQINDNLTVCEVVILDKSKAEYPQYVSFQAKNEAAQKVKSTEIGKVVTVYFNLRGREFVKDGQSKYFNTLEVWKVD